MPARKRIGSLDFLNEVPLMDLITLYITEKINYIATGDGNFDRVLRFEDALRQKIEKLEENIKKLNT